MDRAAPLHRRQWLRQSLALGLWAAGPGAQAQGPRKAAWPLKPVELVVPFPNGGTSSLLARELARVFEQQTQQPMRLEHRGGAGGTLGASYVAKADVNGYHLLFGGTSQVITRALMPGLDYDLLEDLVPLGQLAELPQVVLVNPAKLPMRTLPELWAELRRKPARYRYASAGVGSATHLAGELLRHLTGAHLAHVPYRGSGPAIQDVVTGHVDLIVEGIASALPHVRAGRLRPVLLSGPARSPLLPEVPTAAEVGLPDFDVNSWYGLFAPAGIAAPLRERMVEVLEQLAAQPELQKAWTSMGVHWSGRYGTDFETYLREDARKWARIVKLTGAGA